MARTSQNLHKKKRRFWNLLPPKKEIAPKGLTPRDMMSDPIVQCFTFLTLVISSCLLWKSTKFSRRIKTSSRRSLLSTRPNADSLKRNHLNSSTPLTPPPDTPTQIQSNLSPPQGSHSPLGRPSQSLHSPNSRATKLPTMTSQRLLVPEKLNHGFVAASSPNHEIQDSAMNDISSDDDASVLDKPAVPDGKDKKLAITIEGGPIGRRPSQLPGRHLSADDVEAAESSVMSPCGSVRSAHSDSTHQRSCSSMSGGSYHARRSPLHRANSIGSLGSCDASSLGSSFTGADQHPYMTIYFASQNGTSAYYAAQLQREGIEMGFATGLRSVRSFSKLLKDAENPEETLRRVLVPHTTLKGKLRGRSVFMVSTYHEGGPSDDAIYFVELLKSLKSKKCMKGLRYAIIGFGDSAYGQTFNMQAKLYDTLFEELGGKRMMPPGLLDQSRDLEMEMEAIKWRTFWPALADLAARDSFMPTSVLSVDTGESTKEERRKRKALNKQKKRSSSLIEDPEGGFVLELVEGNSPRNFEEYLAPLHASSRHFVQGVDCYVNEVEALWIDPSIEPIIGQRGSVMRVEFDLTPSADGIEPFRYETGDNIAVLPINRLDLVEGVAGHLDYGLDSTFVLVPRESFFETPFPSPCTVRDYLSHYCELSTPPRRSVVRALSRFATLARDRDELHRISSADNFTEFNDRIVKENIGIGSLLIDYFPSIRIPLVNFIRLCSPLQPRWYSVSSSPLVNPSALTITFSVVSIPRTIDNSICFGACSHYLSDLSPAAGDTCRIMKMGRSGFVVPPQPGAPVIMVCNGTGLAPMRALLQELNYKKVVRCESIGPVLLFFGIRRKDLDFLYRSEIERYQEAGTLSELHLACSQDQSEKVYVQHVLAKKSDRVWEALQCGAHMYVCGANKMTSDVDAVLRSVVTNHLAPIEATAFLDQMERSGRYVREGWSSKTEA